MSGQYLEWRWRAWRRFLAIVLRPRPRYGVSLALQMPIRFVWRASLWRAVCGIRRLGSLRLRSGQAASPSRCRFGLCGGRAFGEPLLTCVAPGEPRCGSRRPSRFFSPCWRAGRRVAGASSSHGDRRRRNTQHTTRNRQHASREDEVRRGKRTMNGERTTGNSREGAKTPGRNPWRLGARGFSGAPTTENSSCSYSQP